MLCFVNNNVLIWLPANKCSKSGGDEVGAALSWTLLLHYLSRVFLQLFFFTHQDDEVVHSQGSSQKFALL